MARDVAPGTDSSLDEASEIAWVTSDTRVVFAAWEPLRGEEPWMSDGTSSGTSRVADFAFGRASSHARDFVRSGATVYCTADVGSLGRELWGLPSAGLCGVVVESIGEGCVGSASIPTLGWKALPALGSKDFALELRGARARAPSVLVLGTALAGRVGVGVGGSCRLWAAPQVVLVGATDNEGEQRVPLPLPDDKSLIGFALWLQAATIDAKGAAFGGGVTTSGAVRCELGYGN